MKIKNKSLRFLDVSSGAIKKHKNLVNSFTKNSTNFHHESVLYSRGKRTKAFFTEDSKLYITPKEAKLLRGKVKLNRNYSKFDSLSSRVVHDFVAYRPSSATKLVELLENRYALLAEQTALASQNLLGQFSLVRLWNFSIIGSILFGMVAMTFVYRFMGQGALEAKAEAVQLAAQEQTISPVKTGKVVSLASKSTQSNEVEESLSKQIAEIQLASDRAALEKEIYGIVKGHPIEKLVPYIAQQDRKVAAFFIAIAKKESNWGKHVPVLDGKDCYNYVGYRGQRDRMGSGGHTCFDSPQDAVATVAKRIETLVKENERDTAAKMVVWKCGSNCAATGGQAAANKWISDVDSILQIFKT